MPLDKFGRSARSSASSSLLTKFQFASAFKYTTTGDLDVENLKICNVNEPTLDNDVANKKYVDSKNSIIIKHFDEVDSRITLRFKENETRVEKLQAVSIANNRKFEDKLKTVNDRLGQIERNNTGLIDVIKVIERNVSHLLKNNNKSAVGNNNNNTEINFFKLDRDLNHLKNIVNGTMAENNRTLSILQNDIKALKTVKH